MQKLNMRQIRAFQTNILDYYHKNKRDFPWRTAITPYKIVVSEIMLQQTQAPRAVEKFKSFIKQFPNFSALHHAEFKDVLIAWQGLGYNRRAKYLKQIAQMVTTQYKGRLPQNPEVLKTLPGIGSHTAGSICAFAFNLPIPFIETNIRSVFIHEFFKDKNDIHDKDIWPLVEHTLYIKNPREWYNALMDYGAMLKEKSKNPSRKSVHYIKQSAFKGSDRELRGRILKVLTTDDLKLGELISKLEEDERRVEKNVDDLMFEKMIKKIDGTVSIY
ncbi:MAG: A/G-specific adenine glycosylase [Candidatus Magasanikbacteria bacterium]|nr:A/G-specific adenine glycosylase [Candidatus Magasanikbacteria bacterium]